MSIRNLPFVADQRVYSLELNADERRSARTYLQLEKLPDRGLAKEPNQSKAQQDRWHEEPDRFQLLADRRHQRIAVTVSGGIGKTKLMQQLAIARESAHPGHLVVSVHFQDVPEQASDDHSEHLDPVFSLILQQYEKQLQELAERTQSELPSRDHSVQMLTALIRTGNLTLAVDGLDEVNVTEGKGKADSLRSFLNRHPNCRCVVAGRPYSLTQYYWRRLFSTTGNADDFSSEWHFWLVGTFDRGQIDFALGENRLLLKQLEADIEFTPRTLQAFRMVTADEIATIRSVADVYWYSIDRSLRLDRKKQGLPVNTTLSHDEILDFLSACAITLVMWKHDPHSNGDRLAGRSDAGHAPVRQVQQMSKYKKLVFARMRRLYGESWDVTSKWEELKKLNSNHLEFEFFHTSDADKLIWRNATDRDFFASLWMVRSSDHDEQSWLGKRQSSVLAYPKDKSRNDDLNELWRFVCGVPDQVMLDRDDAFDQFGRWWGVAEQVCDCNQPHSRSTELMYRCWPNLLRRANYLQSAAWSEEQLMRATHDAQLRFQNGCKDVGRNQKIVAQFLLEYPRLRDSSGPKATLIQEDLEGHWCDCDSSAGKEVVVGHSKESDNVVRSYTVPYRFSLCAYQVTNRLYELFDCRHSGRFDDYSRYSPYRRGPAVYLSWYDSMMFSIWSHGYLANEWIWEYASRAGATNEAGKPATWPWGDDESELDTRAWVLTNSGIPEQESGLDSEIGVHAHPVGLKRANGFGLHDTIGNVWEWGLNVYGLERQAWGADAEPNSGFVSRVLRGGSFLSESFITRCSCRNRVVPSYSNVGDGCRVARAHFP